MADFKARADQVQNEPETPCTGKGGSAQRCNNRHRSPLKGALTRQFGDNLSIKILIVIDYNPMNR